MLKKDGLKEQILKNCCYSDCLFSTKLNEEHASFFNATIYKSLKNQNKDPRAEKKDSLINLKDGKSLVLSPLKYGGYSSESFAYFAIIQTKDKKGNSCLQFIEVPFRRLVLGEEKLKEWIKETYGQSAKIIRKVLKQQVVETPELGRVRISGLKNRIIDKQLPIGRKNLEINNYVFHCLDGWKQYDRMHKKEDNFEENKQVYRKEMFDRFINFYMEKLGQQKALSLTYDKFLGLVSSSNWNEMNQDKKESVIKDLLKITKSDASRADLKYLGDKFSVAEGMIVNLFSANKPFTIINKSVTGFYESKEVYGESK